MPKLKRTRWVIVCLIMTIIFHQQPIPTAADPTCAANQIGGTIFVDRDIDGQRDASEPDIDLDNSGIVINAYDDANTVIGTTTVADASGIGAYVITLNPVPSAGDTVRVEFEIPPDGAYYSPSRFPEGATQPFGTTVAFVEAGDCTVDQGLSVTAPADIGTTAINPFDGCASAGRIDDVNLYTSCFVFADGSYTDMTPISLVSYPYQSGIYRGLPDASGTPTEYDTGHTNEAYAGNDTSTSPNFTAARALGSTYGTAFHQRGNILFAAAYLKRHSAFGFGGAGAIYAIDRTQPLDSASRYSLFATIPNAGSVTNRAVIGDPIADWRFDDESFTEIGKVSLGDMDLDDIQQNLYVLNLGDQSLYRVAIGAGHPTAGAIDNLGNLVTVVQGDAGNVCNTQANGTVPAAEIRPFAVKIHYGQVYVGVTCTAETSVSYPFDFNADDTLYEGRNLMGFIVYRYDPTTTNFTRVLDFPMQDVSYNPTNNNRLRGVNAWRRWNDFHPTTMIPPTGEDQGCFDGFCNNPQPILADIEFDEGGDMILGFRDRWGDMMGANSFNSRNTSDSTTTFSGIAFGDIVRVCYTGTDLPSNPPSNGQFELERNGACPSRAGSQTLGGSDATYEQYGPNGGAYFYEDYFHDPAQTQNMGFGGLAFLPGSDLIAMTVQDPIPNPSQTSDGGVMWFHNRGDNGAAGSRARSFLIYNGQVPTTNTAIAVFGKSNGLGDIEVNCPLNLEIGNYVWIDTDRDGIQDPNERRVTGVTVRLYEDTNGNGVADDGNPVGTTLTDVNGQFLFNETNVSTPLDATTTYRGLKPYTNYVITVNYGDDFESGGPLAGYFPTRDNVIRRGPLESDLSDSDGSNQGWLGNSQYSALAMQTRGIGQNDHTWDFGFINEPPPEPLPPGEQAQPTPTQDSPLDAVTELPATGETPFWRLLTLFIVILGAGGFVYGWRKRSA